MNDEGQKKKPGMMAPNRHRLYIMVGAAVAVFIILMAVLGYFYFQTSPLDSVKFANGKTVTIGMTEAQMKKIMGKDIYASPGSDEYAFLNVANNQFDATIIVKSGKVAVIRYSTDKGAMQEQSNVIYHTPIADIKKMFAGKLTKIDKKLPYDQSAVGYVHSNTWRTKSYYFISPCEPSDQVMVVAVADKKYESNAIGGGIGCGFQAK